MRGVFDQHLLSGGPPFLVFDRADHTGEQTLDLGRHHGLIIAGGNDLADQIGRLLFDHLFNQIRLRAGAHKDIVRLEDIEFIHAESGRHGMTVFTIFKVDDQAVVGCVIVHDFAETPAAVQAVVAGHHGFEFRTVRNQFRILFDESVYGLFIHNDCLS